MPRTFTAGAVVLDPHEHAAGAGLALPAPLTVDLRAPRRFTRPRQLARCGMASPKILVFAGSIRTGALSGKLAALAAKELALADADVTRISLADYPLPSITAISRRKRASPRTR